MKEGHPDYDTNKQHDCSSLSSLSIIECEEGVRNWVDFLRGGGTNGGHYSGTAEQHL